MSYGDMGDCESQRGQRKEPGLRSEGIGALMWIWQEALLAFPGHGSPTGAGA